MGLDDLRPPLARLLADREQADRRLADLQHGGAEGGAEEGELDEVLGTDLDVGADVEEEHRFARRGIGTASAGRCTPLSRRRPKVAAAIVAPVEPRLTIAAALPSATSRAARTTEASLVADRLDGVVLVADPFGGRDHLDPVHPLQPERALRPEDPHPDPVGGGAAGALGQYVETLLRPETVEGDRHRAACATAGQESAVVTVGSVTLWETTSRPA